MSTKGKDETMETLRRDPDFKALVKALESQSPKQIEAFYSHYGQKEEQGTEDVNADD
jgi:hypothetical protein